MSTTVLHSDNALIYTSGMNVDADGCPRAYHPGGGGLDALGNAGHPGNWYGVVTDTGDEKGTPFIQGPHDPYPGYYVSASAYSDHTKKASDPTRYVDSEHICYISVPKEMVPSHGGTVHMGDLCAVLYRGKLVFGLVADDGPTGKYGEASMATAAALGIPSSPRNGGCGSGVTYVIFPGTTQPWPRTSYQADAQAAFEAWGGLTKLNSILAAT